MDKMSGSEIRNTVRRIAQGDPIVKEILFWNLRYNGGRCIDEPSVVEGIRFWCVGHNASHSFYAGVKDGKRYQRAFGESADSDFDDDDFPRYEESIREVPNFHGYYGHF
ncbi:MAG TPA: hypothetical protein VD998_00735 [Verrucomicrobiae bacterium]|nr:hypothetical protein [Verrucomicrobiae bacterium]